MHPSSLTDSLCQWRLACFRVLALAGNKAATNIGPDIASVTLISSLVYVLEVGLLGLMAESGFSFRGIFNVFGRGWTL